MTITELFDPDSQLSINRNLMAKLGLTEAVMFSVLCSKYNEVKRANSLYYGMFVCTVPELEAKTGLTYYKQIKAIDNLEKANLIATVIEGMPAKKYYKINERNLLEFLQTTESIDFTAFLNNNVAESIDFTDNSSKKVSESTENSCFQITQKQSLYNNISNNNLLDNNIYNNKLLNNNYSEYVNTHLEKEAEKEIENFRSEDEHVNDVLENLKKELSMQKTKDVEKRNGFKRYKNDFLGSANIKDDTKQNRYQQYSGIIYKFSDDATKNIQDPDRRTFKRKELQEKLFLYLNMLLEDKGGRKTLYTNVFKGMLAKLQGLADEGNDMIDVINQSLERGYRGFYPINPNFRKRLVVTEKDLIDEIADIDKVNDGSQDVTNKVY